MRVTPQSSTDSCGEQGTSAQPQPQPVVVGQTISQQYPQSPVQGVPGTQVRILAYFTKSRTKNSSLFSQGLRI